MKPIIDNRIELISIIHYLGEYRRFAPVVTETDSEYTELINIHFAKFKNHDAIKFSDYLAREKAFGYDGPYYLILHYSLIDKLEKQANISKKLAERIQQNDIKHFVTLLNNFISDTNFFDFIDKAQGFYLKLTNSFYNNYSKYDYKEILVDYYGYEKPTYNLFIAPLNRGSYGSKVDNPLSIYSIIGIDNATIMDAALIRNIDTIIWHEFGHSYIDDIQIKFMDKIDSMDNLFEPISETMVTGYNAYGPWSNCFNEHIVRAITNRLILLHYGQEIYTKYIDWDKDQGFVYIHHLDELLSEYENNRLQYSIFDDYYPTIIDYFMNLSKEEAFTVK